MSRLTALFRHLDAFDYDDPGSCVSDFLEEEIFTHTRVKGHKHHTFAEAASKICFGKDCFTCGYEDPKAVLNIVRQLCEVDS